VNQFSVLMYHEILPRSSWPTTGAGPVRTAQGVTDVLPPPLYVWEEDFVAQMEFLAREGFNAVSARDVVEFYRTGASLPPRAVLLTFDDLWKGGMTTAYPVLKRLGVPALSFLVRGWIFSTPQDPLAGSPVCLALGEWEALGDVFSFANHTDALHVRGPAGPALLSVTPEVFTSDLRRCEEWTTQKGVFAYPFGAVGEVAPRVLADEGFHLGFTTEPGLNDSTSDPLRLRRNLVPCGAGLDQFASLLAL